MFLSALTMSSGQPSFAFFSPTRIRNSASSSVSFSNFLVQAPGTVKHLSCCCADSRKSDHNPKPKPTRGTRARTSKDPKNKGDKNSNNPFPAIIPKKPRRGRRSESAAVEDFVRDSLERTLESIGKQNPEILENMEKIMKEKKDGDNNNNNEETSDESDSDEEDEEDEKEMLVEEDDPDWPLDADVGWGIKASEYFDKHSIKNVVGEDGAEIDWEGEVDDALVKEINCLEWESFAFHPSPLIVLVFERYNRASNNWKVLKELEKAAEVYWKAKDRLPPRTVKIDINIERDLAYALKVKECPQILFLRGNKILYRENDFRSADELVQMIAHFYYNAKKPSCINDVAISSPPHQWR